MTKHDMDRTTLTERSFDQKHDYIFETDLKQLVGIIPGIWNFGGDKSPYPLLVPTLKEDPF